MLYALKKTKKSTSWRSSHKLSIALEKFYEKKRMVKENQNNNRKKFNESTYKQQSNLNESSLYVSFLSIHLNDYDTKHETKNQQKIRTRNIELCKYFSSFILCFRMSLLIHSDLFVHFVKRRNENVPLTVFFPIRNRCVRTEIFPSLTVFFQFGFIASNQMFSLKSRECQK